MIFRIRPTKDSFISNSLRNAVQKTGSNYGFAESIEIFKISGVSGATGPTSGSQLSRALLYFSTASLDNFISSRPLANTSKVYRLFAQHETTADGCPQSFDLRVRCVSGSWDEGGGTDTTDFSDSGFCNWMKRTSVVFWSNPGGDFRASPESTQHFDIGDENLDVDITSMFNAWSSGSFPNDGLSVTLGQAEESESLYQDFFKKSFYSRHSQWPDRRPYVDVTWDDFIGDDRNRIVWNRTGSLFLHNIVDGQYASLSYGTGTFMVSIADSSGTLLQVTASQTQMVGVYRASFALPTGSYSGSVFYDRWGSGSFAFMTGSFTIATSSPVASVRGQVYTINVPNVRDIYDADEVVRFDVLFKNRGQRQNVVLTASLTTKPDIIEKCYYAIENESTRHRIIPFGTGSAQHTRLSYDDYGNYFIFPMLNLHSGEIYRIVFLIDRNGQRQVVDGNAKFRVR